MPSPGHGRLRRASRPSLRASSPISTPKLLLARFTDGRKFLWVRRKLSPEQMQAVHDIGDPGLLFGPREMRLYPNGRLAAHVLGGASFGARACIRPRSSARRASKRRSTHTCAIPALAGKPVAAVARSDGAGHDAGSAGGRHEDDERQGRGGDPDGRAHRRDPRAWCRLPDFDPNDRPQPLLKGDPGDSPLFNRAVQGVYELGSTFKIFAAAQAIDIGLVNPDTMVDADAPMLWGKFKIKEFENHNYGPAAVGQQCDREILQRRHRPYRACRSAPSASRPFSKSLGFFEPTARRADRGTGREAAAAQAVVRDLDDHHLLWPWHVGQPAAPRRCLCGDCQRRGHGKAHAAEKQRSGHGNPRDVRADRARLPSTMLRSVVTDGTASLRRCRRAMRWRARPAPPTSRRPRAAITMTR